MKTRAPILPACPPPGPPAPPPPPPLPPVVVVEKHDADGYLVERAEMRGGVLDGTTVLYGPGGAETGRAEFKGGVLHGTMTVRDGEGRVSWQAVYHSGALDGDVQSWQAGVLAERVPYVAGARQGTSTSWHPGGAVATSLPWVADKLEGIAVWYSADGRKTRSAGYRAGVLDGETVDYYGTTTAEAVRTRSEYSQGLLHGTVTQYDTIGRALMRSWFQSGEPVCSISCNWDLSALDGYLADSSRFDLAAFDENRFARPKPAPSGGDAASPGDDAASPGDDATDPAATPTASTGDEEQSAAPSGSAVNFVARGMPVAEPMTLDANRPVIVPAALDPAAGDATAATAAAPTPTTVDGSQSADPPVVMTAAAVDANPPIAMNAVAADANPPARMSMDASPAPVAMMMEDAPSVPSSPDAPPVLAPPAADTDQSADGTAADSSPADPSTAPPAGPSATTGEGDDASSGEQPASPAPETIRLTAHTPVFPEPTPAPMRTTEHQLVPASPATGADGTAWEAAPATGGAALLASAPAQNMTIAPKHLSESDSTAPATVGPISISPVQPAADGATAAAPDAAAAESPTVVATEEKPTLMGRLRGFFSRG